MLHQYLEEEFPLSLRPLCEDDIEQLRLWRNLDHIRKNFISSNIISPVQQKSWFDKHKVIENDFVFIIEETSVLNKKIGAISIYNFSKNAQIAEFGRFFIGEADAHGKGYGIQAAKMACNIAFEQMGLEKLLLEVFEDNLPAYKIYKKIGFHEYDERLENGRKLICMELNK
ncbi:MAG: GNAT family N-acetyltransferase [Desulfitobacterium sp.]